MTSPNYIPQAGTIPARVIAFLADKPQDQWFPTAQLLEAIGQPADWNGLITCMATALECGAVRKEISHQEGTSRRMAMWARGPNAPTIEQLAQPVPPPRIPVHPAPALAPATAPVPLPAAEPVVTASLPVEKPEVDGQDEYSYTSTGRLLISADGGHVALSKEETVALFAYLDQVRGIEWEPAA